MWTACFLWMSTALAWEPADGRLLAATDAPADVAFAMVDGAPTLITTGPAGTAVIDPASGRVLAESALAGAALLVTDLDGDGAPDLVLCGPDGVSRLPWDLGAPMRWSDRPCRAITTRSLAGATELIVVDDAVRALTIRADGVSRSVALGAAPRGEVLLAGGGPVVAFAGVGSTAVVEVGPRGTSTTATGAPIGGLTAGAITWAWTIASTATLEDVIGGVAALDPRAGRVTSGDLDLDGLTDVVVAHGDDRIGVVLANGAERRVASPLRADRVTVADVDADGCPDLIGWSSTRQGVAAVYGLCDPSAVASAVRVEGDARTVWLESADGRFPEGDVPAGLYQVRAWFGTSAAVPAGMISVPEEGGPVTLRCNAAMMRCVRVE